MVHSHSILAFFDYSTLNYLILGSSLTSHSILMCVCVCVCVCMGILWGLAQIVGISIKTGVVIYIIR